MYQVIVILDESRQKSYYHSYVISEDVTLGNISCEDLPPYQDINKARSCYWDADNSKWIFDEEKYVEICEMIEADQIAKEEAEAEAASQPSNAEIMGALMELAANQSELSEAVSELGEVVACLTE